MTAIAEPEKQERQRARPLPPAIRERLGALRGRMRSQDATLGVAFTALAIGVFIHGTFLLDRLLDLPSPFRATMLALGVGAVLWIARSRLWAPLTHARSDDDVALLYERAHPELNDALISAVQLSRGAGAVREVHSDAMVGEVVAAAESRAKVLDPGKVAGGGDARRAMLLALAVAAITVLLFATRERDGSIWFQRMILLQDTPWPRTVDLEVAIGDDPWPKTPTHPKDAVFAKGDDVLVRARVLRGQPSRIAIVPEFPTLGRADPIAMVDARGEWRVTLENVAEPFRFFVEGGDYRSQWFKVDVRPRPRIEELSAWLEHPSYTHLPDTPQAEPLKDLNVKVPGGTLVRWRAKASAALKAAELVFGTPASVTDVEAATLSSDGRTLEGKFRVKDSTAATVRLVSPEGFETPAAGQYQVRAITDRLPDVRIPKPGRNKDVAKAATVKLRIEVKDDYQPRAAALVVQVLAAGKKEPSAEARTPLPGLPPTEPGAKGATIDWSFELAQIAGGGAGIGDRITYWVEAVDERAGEGGTTESVPLESRGRSEKYQLHVISDDDLLRALQTQLKRVRDELMATAKAVKATATDMEALAGELAGRAAPDPKDRRRITYAALDHTKAVQKIAQAQAQFSDVKEEMVSNKVGKEDDLRWIGGLEADAGRLVTDQGARAAADLAKLRQEDRPDAGKVAQVAQTQKEIVEALDAMVRNLDKRDEFNEVLRGFRDLLGVQERIQKDTQERAKQDLNK